ncbi:hypothetical protein [Caballeronia sp. NCTM5]|uniref:hypothetical protein n=1 Tax=Caballeronia sp. NCTM5 TaxID=2921755 RepID=UPI002028B37E|nr:hypothetical protein [Caballeronia sp. NCTM5]
MRGRPVDAQLRFFEFGHAINLVCSAAQENNSTETDHSEEEDYYEKGGHDGEPFRELLGADVQVGELAGDAGRHPELSDFDLRASESERITLALPKDRAPFLEGQCATGIEVAQVRVSCGRFHINIPLENATITVVAMPTIERTTTAL